MQDVWDLFAGALTHSALEDEEVAMGEDDMAAGEGGMEAWFAVEDA